ncbi:YbaB/EbfC family nucleoid-associated protein [Myxococcota bacterium]|nr:YbaB/EbfC family nucleoid-associated protein [Myxococcota bacterium]MBU1432995.1 YbaB/EbfC family nucleoid-associated protein [Myxococcota bacterium]MBU1897770.1 YbaB/EbfC family nucleoid-associated protein [Myxococcota bacterium]
MTMAKQPGTGGNIMLQARRMQSQIKQLQENLNEEEFEGAAGGGLVKVVVDGRQNVKRVEINPEAINPDDLDELADLVQAATNMALTESKDRSQSEMKKITGGINLPGLF